jgi:hypothetical protein
MHEVCRGMMRDEPEVLRLTPGAQRIEHPS